MAIFLNTKSEIPTLCNPAIRTSRSRGVLVLAHGAGAPMDSPFMNSISSQLSFLGITVIRFEFPYMAQRRIDGKKRPPNRLPVLLEAWHAIIEQLKASHQLPSCTPVLVGGKSMGGRIATHAANTLPVDGVVCLGYPFHPPGKPDKLRVEHLPTLSKPTLIVQGTRDRLGNESEVLSYELGPNVEVKWLEDGDHDFSPRKKSGLTQAELIIQAVQAIDLFITALAESSARKT